MFFVFLPSSCLDRKALVKKARLNRLANNWKLISSINIKDLNISWLSIRLSTEWKITYFIPQRQRRKAFDFFSRAFLRPFHPSQIALCPLQSLRLKTVLRQGCIFVAFTKRILRMKLRAIQIFKHQLQYSWMKPE